MNERRCTDTIEHFVVSAKQMAAIEQRMFKAGMPVAALMEKVAGLITEKVMELYPLTVVSQVGVMVGPGHNGGDALVVARELHLKGYEVRLYRPLVKGKELTQAHYDYAISLGIPVSQAIEGLSECEVIIDGLFGFGMTRSLTGDLAAAVGAINHWSIPVISIDLPSGLDTDTGEVLGSAIEADYTFCLGLWKRAFFQDRSLPYLGKVELINFGIPLADVKAVLGEKEVIKTMSESVARSYLPLPRPLVTHKYKQGHLLIIAGSRQYAGGVILTGLGARGSGVGMVSIAAPTSLKSMLVTHLPEAIIMDCAETESVFGRGGIAELPTKAMEWDNYDAIVIGPGLTLEARLILPLVLEATTPLIIDADALNTIAQSDPITALKSRSETTILTPHPGEFKRLFPQLVTETNDFITRTQIASEQTETTILLKGARSIIAGEGETWVIPESTPALARGGSGDVLAGLLGGLIAQSNRENISAASLTATAAVWHAQTGIIASKVHSDLGVDAFTLTQYLSRWIVSAS